MSLWLNNLLSYVEKHEEGFCPECGSANIAVTVAGEPRKTILFRCRDCGSSEVFNNNVYEGKDTTSISFTLKYCCGICLAIYPHKRYNEGIKNLGG